MLLSTRNRCRGNMLFWRGPVVLTILSYTHCLSWPVVSARIIIRVEVSSQPPAGVGKQWKRGHYYHFVRPPVGCGSESRRAQTYLIWVSNLLWVNNKKGIPSAELGAIVLGTTFKLAEQKQTFNDEPLFICFDLTLSCFLHNIFLRENKKCPNWFLLKFATQINIYHQKRHYCNCIVVFEQVNVVARE